MTATRWDRHAAAYDGACGHAVERVAWLQVLRRLLSRARRLEIVDVDAGSGCVTTAAATSAMGAGRARPTSWGCPADARDADGAEVTACA
ncbi:hypothetical protein BH20ACT8_BH20ACT8_03990 [soil metagenome]|jgi:hypothetical protein